MQSVGQRLRQTREAQGRSLEEIHSSTRISMRSLEAIEQDDAARASSAFHYRSFVRQIAAVLGIDFAELEPGVNELTGQLPAPLMPGEGVSAPRVAALRIGGRRSNKLLYSLTSFAAVLVGCTAFYAFLEGPRFNVPKAIDKVAGSTSAAVLPPAPAGMTPGQASPGANPQSGNEGLLARKGAGFTVELSATEPVWLSIVEDGKKSFDGVLQRAQTKVLEGHRTARVKTANAGGVEVIFNGRSLGALGLHGQAKTVLFTKTRYEVLSDSRPVASGRVNQSAGLKRPSMPVAAPQGLEPGAGFSNPSEAAASDAPEQ